MSQCERGKCTDKAVVRLKLVSTSTNQPLTTELLCEEHRQMENTMALGWSIAKHHWSPVS